MKTYHQELNEIVAGFFNFKIKQGESPLVKPDETKDRLTLLDDGTLTPESARDLHAELCRQHGLTADEIIADWNRRSPDDLW